MSIPSSYLHVKDGQPFQVSLALSEVIEETSRADEMPYSWHIEILLRGLTGHSLSDQDIFKLDVPRQPNFFFFKKNFILPFILSNSIDGLMEVIRVYESLLSEYHGGQIS